MRYAAITERLAGLGGQKWAIHARAKDLRAQGRDVLLLTIGEPDMPTPPELIAAAHAGMQAGRTGYSNGQGEPVLLAALSQYYSKRSGRMIGLDQVTCFPGTQTTLFAVMMALADPGCDVLLGDPMYAAYEGLIAATGARAVPVPLYPEAGFRMRAEDLADRITPASRIILLNSPHNPTGAVLDARALAAIGAIAKAHDLWLVVDEVYEHLVFDGVRFASPLSDPELADRVIVASSLSKSHAAPGFRTGWCIGPAEFCARLLPLSETILFGNQPFIADMTAAAIAAGSPVAAGMRARFAARATRIHQRLDGVCGLRVHRPEAGMFALIDVRALSSSGEVFALELLERTGVAVMPGESFGASLAGWVRVALTAGDAATDDACNRIIAHVQGRLKAIA